MRTITLTLMAAMALAALSFAAHNSKEIVFANHCYKITVPHNWSKCSTKGSEFMELYMRTPNGEFHIQKLNRNRTSPDKWVEYHIKNNLPAVHGDCSLGPNTKVKAGDFEGEIISATSLQKHRGYNLTESIIFTPKHVLVFSYLHTTDCAAARMEINRVLLSLKLDSEMMLMEENAFAPGSVLDFEKLGMFFPLPVDWKIQSKQTKGYISQVLSPSGRLTVYTFKNVRGLDSLVKQMKIKGLGEVIPHSKTPLRTKDAYMVKVKDKEELHVVIGLSRKNGFVMTLVTRDGDELDTLKAIAAQAVFLNKEDLKQKYKRALTHLKQGIKTDNEDQVKEALIFLQLFASNRKAMTAVAKGLETTNSKIQLACANSLGVMGSPHGTKALIKTLKKKNLDPKVIQACIRAIARIGGKAELKILKKLLEEHTRSDIRRTLNRSICSLTPDN